jgi:hypothetical protein
MKDEESRERKEALDFEFLKFQDFLLIHVTNLEKLL